MKWRANLLGVVNAQVPLSLFARVLNVRHPLALEFALALERGHSRHKKRVNDDSAPLPTRQPPPAQYISDAVMAASLIGFHGKGGIRDLRLLALEELGLFLSLLLLLLPHPNVPADSSTANSLLKETTRQKVGHSNEHCARKKHCAMN